MTTPRWFRLLRAGGLLVLLLLAAAGLAYYRAGIPTHHLPAQPLTPAERPARPPATGPLRTHPRNPRYFADADNRVVFLTGAHTWSNLQDNGFGDPPPIFDYEAYLDFLVAHNLNFTRLWSWEQARWGPWVRANNYFYHPGPAYRRTGPGDALDGKLRFNLDSLDDAYFERVRSRVAAASERGVYVAVMLFNGWAIDNAHSRLYRGNPWHGHPFHRQNNLNGIDGDPNRNDGGEETHELRDTRITAYQDAYVRRLIDAVNDFDNVLYEISNESYSTSKDWQYRMIELIRTYERSKPKQHPIGMTQYQWPGRNADLLDGPADWIAPWEELPEFPYRDNPRVADGRKVVIVDTDHLWGIGGDRTWAWKTFLRGNQPSFMDGYDGASVGNGAPQPWDVRLAGWKDIVRDVLRRTERRTGWQPDAEKWASLRANMGYILDYARRVQLEAMTPRPDVASTGYALVHASKAAAEYLVYLPPATTTVDVDLSQYDGVLEQEWFDPSTATTKTVPAVRGGALQRFTSPFGNDAVLYLHSASMGESAAVARAAVVKTTRPTRMDIAPLPTP